MAAGSGMSVILENEIFAAGDQSLLRIDDLDLFSGQEALGSDAGQAA